MIKKYLFLFFLLAPGLVFGASNNFKVSYMPFDDVTPPTAPVLLSVIPVAPTQIDILWGASTDDLGLAGYVVLRDGNTVATTSQLTFSDGGLTASTTYTYEIFAFDNAFNYSTVSNSLATTTLPQPVIPPVEESEKSDGERKAGGTLPLKLENIHLNSTENEVDFVWKTNRPARFSLSWGTTSDMTSGYISNGTYRENQKTVLYNLNPNTIYFYKLVGIDTAGRLYTLESGEIKTKTQVEKLPMPNVSRFVAKVFKENDVELSWQLPLIANLEKVRVVRSSYTWPTSLNDGVVVYEGLKAGFLDKGALATNKVQYYTIFAVSEDQEVSSGALALVKKEEKKDLGNNEETEKKPDDGKENVEVEENKNEQKEPEVSLYNFSTNSIEVSQNGERYSFSEDRIPLNYRDYFLISIPRESLPPHLKVIVATLVDPKNHNFSYSFLLKLNEEKTAYEATLAPLQVLGISSLQIEILDLESTTIGRYKKQIDFVVGKNTVQTEKESVTSPNKIVKSVLLPVIAIFTLFCLILLFIILLQRRKRKE